MQPTGGLGIRPDHPHLHDQSPSHPWTGGSPTGSLPRAFRSCCRHQRRPASLCGSSPARRLADLGMLKRWFRQFVEVRDSEGAERSIVSAVDAGAGKSEMVDFLFASATDHRFIDVGHVADFTNKALEALDSAGWDLAAPVLASLASSYAGAGADGRIQQLALPGGSGRSSEQAFEKLPGALEAGRRRRRPGESSPHWIASGF